MTTILLKCAICGRQAQQGVTCTACMIRIGDDLDTILTTYALSGEPSWPVPGNGRSSEASLPGGTAWMDWRHGEEMFGCLGTWVRDWMETYGLAGPKTGDLTNIVGWLRAHITSACNSHPAIDDFAYEVSQWARKGKVITGQTQQGQNIACPAPDGDGVCGRRLRIDAHQPAQETTCPLCRTHWTTARLLLLSLHSDTEAWVDPEAASIVTQVDESTLRRWARQGKIRRRNGQYELGSIRDAKSAAA